MRLSLGKRYLLVLIDAFSFIEKIKLIHFRIKSEKMTMFQVELFSSKFFFRVASFVNRMIETERRKVFFLK